MKLLSSNVVREERSGEAWKDTWDHFDSAPIIAQISRQSQRSGSKLAETKIHTYYLKRLDSKLPVGSKLENSLSGDNLKHFRSLKDSDLVCVVDIGHSGWFGAQEAAVIVATKCSFIKHAVDGYYYEDSSQSDNCLLVIHFSLTPSKDGNKINQIDLLGCGINKSLRGKGLMRTAVLCMLDHIKPQLHGGTKLTSNNFHIATHLLLCKNDKQYNQVKKAQPKKSHVSRSALDVMKYQHKR